VPFDLTSDQEKLRKNRNNPSRGKKGIHLQESNRGGPLSPGWTEAIDDMCVYRRNYYSYINTFNEYDSV